MVANRIAKPFSTLLISARGEIACRIIRTARRLGLRTVAVYSDADANSLHVRVADAAHRIGGPTPSDSYLHVDRILDAAVASGAGAIHPGYGFLSENPHFAQSCKERGIVFVGPPADVIRTMGSKSAARQAVSEAGVPIIPGYHGADQSNSAFVDAAKQIGYPVIVKPVMGGGGKGMHIVRDTQSLLDALPVAKHEAKTSFGSDALLLEKFISTSRHVEVQVFGDWHGNVVHLYERDCSVQRRHQKIIEEAPASMLDSEIRASMHQAAVATAQKVGYVGAGTVEFIVDTTNDASRGSHRPQQFYFLEMNTRLQVEHPVTEEITGIDLVEWQLKVAAGNKLPLKYQEDIHCTGHSMEARIYAECPEIGFMPQTGTLRAMKFDSEPTPDHLSKTKLRVDSGIEAPLDSISVYYDPLIAKVISFGQDRESARKRLSHALTSSTAVGVRTNIDFCSRILNTEDFVRGGFDTSMLARNESQLLIPEVNLDRTAVIAGIGLLYQIIQKLRILGSSIQDFDAWNLGGFRLNVTQPTKIHLVANVGDRSWQISMSRNGNSFECVSTESNEAGKKTVAHYRMQILEAKTNVGEYGVVRLQVQCDESKNREQATIIISGDEVLVRRTGFSRYPGDLNGRFRMKTNSSNDFDSAQRHSGSLQATSPMPGKIVRLLVSEGKAVQRGDVLFEVEAMKMVHSVKSDVNGSVLRCNAQTGDLIDAETVIVELKEEGT